MNSAPSIVIFDVNETLSDMAPMAERFVEAGAPAEMAKLWFATLLRDGFALTAAGGNGSFAEIGAEALRGLLADAGTGMDRDRAVEHVMAGLAGLGLHPDVADGVHDLQAAGYRLVTLSNGATRVAEELLTTAGIRDRFERLLSVEDAPGWKPAAAAYLHAASACAGEPGQMLLVAVHPWDIHGAAAAGLRTAWINRSGVPYPGYFSAPDYTVASLRELPGTLAGPRTPGAGLR
ncbi:haloacid dehalogenase type II [Arthrobacter sp. Soil763]|uniref:haloacid dehalogenase type II n=1 Tax=Arthrobacter sp. Soil763 TaxID=1736402 RepID=UPI0006F8D3F7|nr:haloacid dehalogenase type II [Arthrobacter sp. Soil763]KRE78208.1 haloacid dehalogenase [Arthrobacter sp. Soil763]